MIIQNRNEMIGANKIYSYIVSECRNRIISGYVVESFCTLVVKSREAKEIISNFPVLVVRNRTKRIPIKEKSTGIKKGWFVLGSFRVKTFWIEVLICGNSFPVPFSSEL